MSTWEQAQSVIGSALGIYVCYLGYGLVQEHIYSTDYDGDKFKNHSLFLVWAQCIVNGLFGFAVTKLVVTNTTGKTKIPVPNIVYFKIALAYIGAMYSSNWALSYVNFPTQALGKSCKLIPVMLSRIVINKKQYHIFEYLCVVLITGGITVFTLAKGAKAGDTSANSFTGILLLLTSLCLDAYTGPTQEAAKQHYNMSEFEMMSNMNLYAVAIVSVGLVATNQALPAIAFCEAHPEILLPIVLFSLLSALGQAIIVNAVFKFNSLVVTTITTTRKFFTILASVVWYGHSLTGQHWTGVSLVFAGLIGDIWFKTTSKKASGGKTT